MEVKTRRRSCFRMSAKLLKKGVFKRMTNLVPNALIPSSDKLGGVPQRFIVILRGYSYRNKNSLLRLGLATGELALKANTPIITLTAKALLSLAARDHKPLAGNIPGTESQSRLRNIRAIATRIFLVEIATIAFPYGRRTWH